MDNNTNVISPVYSSQHTMSKEMVKDFCSVDFHRLKIMFILFICIIACYISLSFVLHIEDLIVIMTVFILTILMMFNYIRLKNTIKISYERTYVSNGKEATLKYDYFDDNIVSHMDALEREYSYDKVSKFFETKHFLMLHLQHNLYITVEKNSLNANVDDVKKFFIDKCVNVKKKKFVNCVNDEKWSIIFLIVFIIVAVGGAVAHLFM